MRYPRFSIATFMAVVFVLAVNFASGDFYFGGTGAEWVDLFNFGTRLMASILVVGLVPLVQGRADNDRQPWFVMGFEVAGTAAALIYLGCVSIWTHSIHVAADNVVSRLAWRGGVLFPWSMLGLLLLPQLAAAFLGGWFHTRYRVNLRVSVECRQSVDFARSYRNAFHSLAPRAARWLDRNGPSAHNLPRGRG